MLAAICDVLFKLVSCAETQDGYRRWRVLRGHLADTVLSYLDAIL
jgi:hypothetical protein